MLIACCAVVSTQLSPVEAALPAPFETGFGTNGVARLSIPLQESRTYAKKVLADSSGRVLALFHIDEYSNEPKVVIGRSSADGDRDMSFGTTGGTEPLALQQANMAIVASSGKIIVAGYRIRNSRASLMVYRLTSSGVLDRTFGVDGYYEIQGMPGRDFGWSTPQIASTSSRIFIGFDINNTDGSNLNFHFVALDHSGALDYSWGYGGGREVIPVAPGGVSAWSSLHTITVLSDGSLLAVGAVYTQGAGRQIVLVKLNDNGYIDQSFDGATSGNGIVKVSFASESDAMMTAVTVLQDDGFVLAGLAGTYYYGPWYYGVAKFLPTGVADSSFGSNGFALSTLSNDLAQLPGSVARQSDGRYVFPVSEGTAMGFMRVESNGTFSSAQGCFKCMWAPDNLNVDSYSLLLQSTGKIVVVGAGLTASSSDAAVVRFLANGSVDPSFGISSVFFTMQRWDIIALKSLPQPDGSIVSLAQGYSGNLSRTLVFKLTSSGSLDPSFGRGGYQFLFAPSDEGLHWTRDLAVQSDGKIVVLSQFRDSNISIDNSVVLWRLNVDGSTDNTFGTNGRTVTSDAQARLQPSSLVPVSSGKILVSLTRLDTSTYSPKPWVFRYLSNGSLDPSFTDSNNFAGGIQPTPGDGDGEMRNIYAAGNDTSYITGWTYINGVESIFVARLLADGTLDPAFAGGRVTWVVGQADSLDGINHVHVGDGGKLTVSGWVSNPATREVIVKLLPNGTPDTVFNGTGRATYQLRDPAGIDWVGTSAVTSTSAGIMVAGGGSIDSAGNLEFFAVAKFTQAGVIDGSFGTGGKVLSDDTFNGRFNDIVAVGPTTNLVTGYSVENRSTSGVVMKIATVMPTPTTAPPSTSPPTTPAPAPSPTTTVPATATSADDIRLAVSTTQTAILKRLKISVPKGGKVAMKSSTAKVCRVAGTKVVATSPGTCRVSVTVTVKGKKSTKTLAIKVN